MPPIPKELENIHFGVPLNGTGFESQWTIWITAERGQRTIWTGFQNRDSGVPLSRSCFHRLRVIGHFRVPLNRTHFGFMVFSFHSDSLSYSFPSQYSQTSQYSQYSQFGDSGVLLRECVFRLHSQIIDSGVPLSGTHCRSVGLV